MTSTEHPLDIRTVTDPRDRAKAKAFLARHMPGLSADAISDDTHSPVVFAVREALSDADQTAPYDHWLTIHYGGELVAVLHAAPNWQEAHEVLRQRFYRPLHGPRWVARYLLRCWKVDEIAVSPRHRGRGYAGALLSHLEADAAAAGVRVLTAMVDQTSLRAFQAAGWLLLPPGTPVPAVYANGLETVWDPSCDGRAWVVREVGGD